jgi:hypothetical protein
MKEIYMSKTKITIEMVGYEFPKGLIVGFDEKDYDVLAKYGFVVRKVEKEEVDLDFIERLETSRDGLVSHSGLRRFKMYVDGWIKDKENKPSGA